MAQFEAVARVPTRPLSYQMRDQAYRKELLIDYTNGLIYVNDENGVIHNVTEIVYNEIIKDPDLISDIKVTLPNGSQVTINAAFATVFQETESIRNNITQINNTVTELSNKTGDLVNPSTGVIDPDKVPNLDADKIIQDATHKFLSNIQLQEITKKVSIVEKIVTISPSDVSGSEAPYACTKTVAGLDPALPAPMIDISYRDNVFENNEKEEDAFYCIHRCSINVVNEARFTFKSKPETTFNVRFQIYTTGLSENPDAQSINTSDESAN